MTFSDIEENDYFILHLFLEQESSKDFLNEKLKSEIAAALKNRKEKKLYLNFH
jgi:hypothetical protein